MTRPDPTPLRREARIGAQALEGTLALPEAPRGLILFAHGSGSSRRSPRNAEVAEALRARGFGTLLFDLLTEDEARDRANVFDIGLLAERVREAMAWARETPETAELPVGLFGAGTGAAAALVAAAREPGGVAAVVSRGGRPDLASEALSEVRAPVRLIVGGADFGVIELNENAHARLKGEKRLSLVPGATHLFEEPGAMEEVERLAGDWFDAHLPEARR